MKRLVACWILGASLAACSSTPLELPTCDIPEAPAAAARPLSVPEMPQDVARTETTSTFDLEGILQLDRLRKASEANANVARLNGEALEARNESINALIECSKYQKVWMEVREDMLEQERKDHALDNFWHRGLIALGVAAAIL